MEKTEIMICKTCTYYIQSNKGYPYCAYYCEFIDRIILLSMCSWLEKDDNYKNRNDRNSAEL